MAEKKDLETKENTEKVEGGEAPKKKKFSIVFRPQNAEKNTVKTRGTAPAKKPAAKAPVGPGGRSAKPAGEEEKPVKKVVKKKPVETETTEKVTAETPAEEKPAKKTTKKAKVEETAEVVTAETPAEEKPAKKSTKKAKAEETAETVASETPAEEKPAKKSTKKAKAEETAETVASETPTEEKPAKKSTKKAKTEEPAEEKPEPAPEKKPAPRMVDLEAVKAAERAIKHAGDNKQRQVPGGGRQGQGRNGQGGQGGRFSDRNGQGRNGQGGQGGRFSDRNGQGNRQGQGGRFADRTGQGQGSRQGGFRQAPAPAPGSYEAAMKKPGKNKNNRSQGNRFDRKNSDELRRPSNAKVSNKDLIRAPQKKQEPEEPQIKMITIPEVLTIKDLANAMKIQPATIIKKLFLQGKVFTVNDEIDYETAENIAVEFEVLCEKEVPVDVIAELLEEKIEDAEEDLVSRPPVVCVMGHVDHGKTSLLDAIRKTNVISKEAGGITQAIGAYTVEIDGRQITFLDTPGHEAFTAMRMRGAQATDIAILVVAADDGVMPQTIEAINHAKAAGVEIIVAINKIDKVGADINRVKQALTEYELVDSEWGGTTTMVPISAKQGEGINDLLEMVLLQADVLELKSNPNRNARGLVIEAQLDKGRGPVATVLVQKGTLKVGDTVAAGASYGKIRAMIDDKGNRVKKAGPSMPVEILGLNAVPNAGEVFISTDSEKDARSFAETFVAEEKKRMIAESKKKVSLDAIFEQIKEGDLKELNIIVKADVQGSVEAVKSSLTELSNEEVVVRVIHSGAGNINESDVTLASASNAIIIGFNVKIDATAKTTAETENVDVRLYDVIYKAIDDVKAAMEGMLDPVFEEQILGHAVVRQTFKASAVGVIAGSFVLDGKMVRGCKCRITRDGEQIYDGELTSLKRFKDDAKEVRDGYECGLVFDGFNDLQEDDQIEAYDMVEVARK